MLTAMAAWWNGDRDFEHEGDGEYPLRDPHESLMARRSRYIQRVADAHNLFHPGHPEPLEHEAKGDPDYNPRWDDGDRDESESGSEESPEQKALGNHPRFIRRHNGRLEVADGHHRVAADMVLGKTHTRGVMIHERDLN